MQSLIKYLCAILIFSSTSITFSQITDSIKIHNVLNPDSIQVKADSLETKDSTLVTAKRDSIVILHSSALSDKSFFVDRNKLQRMEYRYTGDYLRAFPFNFIKDLGFPGQPNETFLYGVGNSAINYLMDGISLNNRYHNSINLNLLQSENIDSVEIVPLPRGFLYGAYNNPVSVNFITRDFVTRQPYSRIRYYQGPDRETMLDGYFNLQISRKFIASFEITNRIVDSTFTNTDFSIWQGKLKLKYLLSNDVNIIATYNYNDYNAGYSGGVDVDSIRRAGGDVNNLLYDYSLAPVLYPNGKVKTLMHHPKLRFLIKPTGWLNTDASIFYIFSENVKNDFTNQTVDNKVYGLNLRNNASYKNFKFQLNIDYEKGNFKNYFYSPIGPVPLNYSQSNSFNYDLFSFAGIISTDIADGKLVPSLFYKLSQISGDIDYLNRGSSDNNSTGFGGDLTFKSADYLSFYFGYSLSNTYGNNDNSLSLEIGTNFKSDFFSAYLKYFINDYQYSYNPFSYGPSILSSYIRFGKVDGLGANISINLWKLSLESTSAYYHSLGDQLIGVPDFQTQTGLYYKDILFEKNLNLKTGLVISYTGKNNVFTAEHGLLEVPSSYKLDFTLAGEIQKVVVVYFLWQNLLNNNYYITPYYPMPSRSIRFGVAWELFN